MNCCSSVVDAKADRSSKLHVNDSSKRLSVSSNLHSLFLYLSSHDHTSPIDMTLELLAYRANLNLEHAGTVGSIGIQSRS